MICWIPLACLAFTACVPPAEGDHLIVHVTCTADFDSMVATLDQYTPFSVAIGNVTQSFDFSHWDVFGGEGPTFVSITVLINDEPVATGMASQIIYNDQSDGTRLAEIAMPLTP